MCRAQPPSQPSPPSRGPRTVTARRLWIPLLLVTPPRDSENDPPPGQPGTGTRTRHPTNAAAEPSGWNPVHEASLGGLGRGLLPTRPSPLPGLTRSAGAGHRPRQPQRPLHQAKRAGLSGFSSLATSPSRTHRAGDKVGQKLGGSLQAAALHGAGAHQGLPQAPIWKNGQGLGVEGDQARGAGPAVLGGRAWRAAGASGELGAEGPEGLGMDVGGRAGGYPVHSQCREKQGAWVRG